MTTKICDTCKKEANNLNQLIDEYKVDGVGEVCDSCLKEINELLDNIRKAQLIQRENFIRRFIRKFKC